MTRRGLGALSFASVGPYRRVISPVRVESPGAACHVTAHSNERRRIVRSTADRRRFLSKLSELREVPTVSRSPFPLASLMATSADAVRKHDALRAQIADSKEL